jgi:hypothetical protein
VTTELEKGKERPCLPDDIDEFNRVLWREIKRGPDGVSSVLRFAQAVAETIARDYTMSPTVQNRFIWLGLIDCLMGILQEPMQQQSNEEGSE